MIVGMIPSIAVDRTHVMPLLPSGFVPRKREDLGACQYCHQSGSQLMTACSVLAPAAHNYQTMFQIAFQKNRTQY